MSKYVKAFEKGDIIFREGDAGDSMYYIGGGANEEVGIYSGYGTDAQVLLGKFSTGDFIGEMGFIGKEDRSATAVALTDVIVDSIEANNYKEYFTEKPYVMMELLKRASQNLRRLTDNYMEACDLVCDYVSAKESGNAISDDIKNRIKELSVRSL